MELQNHFWQKSQVNTWSQRVPWKIWLRTMAAQESIVLCRTRIHVPLRSGTCRVCRQAPAQPLVHVWLYCLQSTLIYVHHHPFWIPCLESIVRSTTRSITRFHHAGRRIYLQKPSLMHTNDYQSFLGDGPYMSSHGVLVYTTSTP